MDLEHISCDLCGNEQYVERYRKPDSWLRSSLFQFPVVQCRNCGLVYVNPRPTEAAMADFYPEGYHDNRDDNSFVTRYRLQAKMLPNLTGKRVLDIGCARGDFLTYLLTHSQFNAFGVDAFSNSVKDERITFTQGTLEEAKYPSNYFDLIMSWAVFEHLHHPDQYFREASRILKPGGQLIILVTNANSLYGRIAQTEDIPRHTYHFSLETLGQYGKKHSLTLTDVNFNDALFDGRGFGTFRMILGQIFGFQWHKLMLDELHPITRAAMKIGSLLDAIIFTPHWESRLRRSGIMVASYDKP